MERIKVIRKEQFQQIEEEIKHSIIELFGYAKSKDFGSYVLFLNNAECREKINRNNDFPVTPIESPPSRASTMSLS